jgi:hypothetical protein
MTTTERLVYMLNQIATNLATDDDPATAIFIHVQQFWDPRMKKLILENGVQNLSPTAAAAIIRLSETQNVH